MIGSEMEIPDELIDRAIGRVSGGSAGGVSRSFCGGIEHLSAMVGPMGNAAIYSIGAVARMVGVSVSTLRTWEDRYGVVVAGRSAGGQRRYSRDQLAQLRFVAREVEAGMLPGD